MATDKETTVEQLQGALARAYCYPKNSKKVLDPDLLEAMVEELLDVVAGEKEL